jgi:hypothetical protein
MNRRYRPPDKVRIEGRDKRQKYSRKFYELCVPALILSVTTSFIWLTATDVLAMVEQLDDDVTEDAVKIAIWKLVKEGMLEKRAYRGERANGFQVKMPIW